MSNKEQFIADINAGYQYKSESVAIGTAILGTEVVSEAQVNLSLKMMNRHGLIAGATGTGKTKTLQVLSEILSDASVPVLLMDIKGDLSGIAMPGTLNDKITDRSQKIGVAYTPTKFPVELLTISNQKGVKMRATVSELAVRRRRT